jgi:hypothetical protein
MQNAAKPIPRNNLNIVCDFAYDVLSDVTVTTYDVQPRTYDVAYDEDHTPSYFGPTTSEFLMTSYAHRSLIRRL